MAVDLSFKNPVFECFAFHATVVLLKMMLIGLLTSYRRLTYKVFANDEDVAPYRGKVAVNMNHSQVERARRNHLNDIENIIPYLLVGFLYVLTGPSLAAAKLHFRIFGVSRLIHTIVYQFGIAQPSRAMVHLVGIAVTFSMAYNVVMATMKAY